MPQKVNQEATPDALGAPSVSGCAPEQLVKANPNVLVFEPDFPAKLPKLIGREAPFWRTSFELPDLGDATDLMKKVFEKIWPWRESDQRASSFPIHSQNYQTRYSQVFSFIYEVKVDLGHLKDVSIFFPNLSAVEKLENEVFNFRFQREMGEMKAVPSIHEGVPDYHGDRMISEKPLQSASFLKLHNLLFDVIFPEDRHVRSIMGDALRYQKANEELSFSRAFNIFEQFIRNEAELGLDRQKKTMREMLELCICNEIADQSTRDLPLEVRQALAQSSPSQLDELRMRRKVDARDIWRARQAEREINFELAKVASEQKAKALADATNYGDKSMGSFDVPTQVRRGKGSGGRRL